MIFSHLVTVTNTVPEFSKTRGDPEKPHWKYFHFKNYKNWSYFAKLVGVKVAELNNKYWIISITIIVIFFKEGKQQYIKTV